MNKKVLGIVVLALGLASIAGGIAVKRAFDMGQYLLYFHIIGGLLLVIGICIFVVGKESKNE